MAMAYRSGMAAAYKTSIIAKAGPFRMPGSGGFADFPATMRMRMHDLERTRQRGPYRTLTVNDHAARAASEEMHADDS